MTFHEITALRHAGQLDEAYKAAKEQLELYPDNIWNKRALAWILHDYLKKNTTEEHFDIFRQYLVELALLELPCEELMVFDATAWQVSKMLFDLTKKNHVDFSKVNILFLGIKDFHFTRPGESYSVLYKAFHKVHETWPAYRDFAEWWDFQHFRPEDYQKEQLPNGRQIMSLAEQAYIAYAKKLLEGEYLDAFGKERQYDAERIHGFLPILDAVIEAHPEFQYPPYFKGKLLMAIGDKDNVLKAFLPFARKKLNEFWVWDLLAETFAAADIHYVACLSRALLCPAEDKFLGKVRQKMAAFLMEHQYYDRAMVEIISIIATSEHEGFRVPHTVQEWTKSPWFEQARAPKHNKDFYEQYRNTAEEILFSDEPEEIIAVEFVNQEKKVLHFVAEGPQRGAIRYDRFIRKVSPGQLLRVRFEDKAREGLCHVFTLKPASGSENSPLVKTFAGQVAIRPGNDFGFVGDIFIDPATIQRLSLHDGQEIKGQAVLSWNKSKGHYGWKFVSINDIKAFQQV